MQDNLNYSSKEEKIDAKRRKIIEFVVRLCSDVFLDVVRWGNRRQLAALEKIGRRLHWQINGCFRKTPFLCLDLKISPCYLICLSGKQVSQTDLTTIPPFVRVNTVRLNYCPGDEQEQIKQKCEWVTMLLQPLRQELNGAKLEFLGFIFDNTFDNSMLFKHIEEELLPICNACHSYYFDIDLWTSYAPRKEVIEKFLQFCPPTTCSNVLLRFHIYDEWPTQLPVDAIANWLHRNRNRNYDSIAAKSVEGKEQILEIRTDGYISNVSAMLSCLKKVFREALFPTRTFTLRLKFRNEFGEEIGHGEKISNRKTGEELLIVWHYFGSLEIKRTAAKDK